MNNPKLFFIYLPYLIICLIFLWGMSGIWMPDGYAIAGHDSGLAIDAKEFLKSRFFAWDSRQNFGEDNSQHFGSITIHTLDYLLSELAGVSYAGNKVSLFFWLALLLISGFIFSYSLKDKLGQLLPILFPIFLTFNFYIFQSVFILERAKFGLFAALLLFLTISFQILDKKISSLLGAMLVSVIFFLFNGGSWLGLPLYGGVGVSLIVLVFYIIITGIKDRNFGSYKSFASFLFFSLLGYLLLNSYSIIPYIHTFLKGDYALLSDTGVLAGNKDWLDYISQRTSLINLLRFQGVPDWYAADNSANLLHPYAATYIKNPVLVIISFCLPLLSFLSFFLATDAKQKRLLGFFGILSLVGIFFTAGTHPPLGFIYGVLFDNISIFSIFRSPYYKFGIVATIGMSVLIAFSINQLLNKLTNYLRGFNFVVFGFCLPVIILWLGFHYVLFEPNRIFRWRENFTTKVEVPAYIEAFSKAASSYNFNGARVLLVPPLNNIWKNDAYNWGYWSLSTLPSVLTSMPVISNNSGLTSEERLWVDKLYLALDKTDTELFLSLAQRLNIGYVLFRKDVLSGMAWSAAVAPENYEKIEGSPIFRNILNIGQWQLYAIQPAKFAKLSTIEKLVGVGEAGIAQKILSPAEHSVIVKDFEKMQGYILADINNYECQSCLLDTGEPYLSLPPIQVLPNSPLYILKEQRDKAILTKTEDNNEKIEAYYGFILRRTSELQSMIVLKEDEEVIKLALDTLISYFEQATALVQSIPGYENDFYRARRALQLINTVERGLSRYVDSADSSLVNGSIKHKVLVTIRQARKLKELYNPVLAERSVWDFNKVYPIVLIPGQETDITIDKSTLPRDLKMQEILPKSLILEIDGAHLTVPFNPKSTILGPQFKIPAQGSAQATLRMMFSDLPNLYRSMGIEYKDVIWGQRSCLTGAITNFNAQKIYRIKITNLRRDQTLSLIIEDETVADDREESGFFYNREEKAIQLSKQNQPFRDYYYPKSESKNPIVLICNADDRKPEVENIEINEVFSPTLYVTKNVSGANLASPAIHYNRINDTRYTITIPSSNAPVILLFNERFSPLWQLNGENKFTHFMADGYANAWVINSNSQEKTYILEYKPHALFSKGILITSISLVLVLGYLIFRLARYVRIQNKKIWN